MRRSHALIYSRISLLDSWECVRPSTPMHLLSARGCVFPIKNFNWSIQPLKFLSFLVALKSVYRWWTSNGNCSLRSLDWRIFSSSVNISTLLLLLLFWSRMIAVCICLFLGRSTSNFTAISELFIANPQISHWRFEVTYSFPTEISSSALNFKINPSPENGSCSISPGNRSTTTLFSIDCSGWVDEDGIKDYSIYSKFICREKEKRMGSSLR